MNIENAIRIFANEHTAEQSHEPGQDHQLGFVLPQFTTVNSVVRLALHTRFDGMQAVARPSSRANSSPARLGAGSMITAPISASSRPSRCCAHRLEVRAASGQRYAQPSHSYTTQRSTLRSGDHFADPMMRLAGFVQQSLGLRQVPHAHHEDHPDPQVERAPIIVFRDVADSPQHLENRRHRPRRPVHPHAQPLWQNPRCVIGDPAAGDVRRSLQHVPLVQRANRLQITLVRLQQFVGDAPAQLRRRRRKQVPRHFEQQLARPANSRWCAAPRRQPEQHVARCGSPRR